MVTVSSGASSVPTSIFALSQCGSDGGFVTLGCVMSGFLPADSQKFKWKGPSGQDLTDFIQYPDIPKDGKYSKMSQIRVQAADWEAKKTFTCEVDGAAAKTPGVTTAGVKKLELPLTTLTVVPQSPVFTGETVTLTCVIESLSGWTYKWYKGSSSVLVSKVNTYTISGAAESHKGQYWCQGESTGRPSTSQPSGNTTLDVKELPLTTLTVVPQSPVFTGETVTLTCVIESLSGWTYKWYKGSSSVLVSKVNTYTISGAAESHKGQYWCQGERTGRPSTSQPSGNTTLDVKELPLTTLTVVPQSPVFTGETVTLTCVIESLSGWTYKWYKGSSSVLVSKVNTYTISGAAESHKGQYWCQGERTGRPSTSQPSGKTTLDVKDPIRLSDQLPVELTPPSSREIFLYRKAELQCITRDTESALNGTKVTWTVGGRDRSGSAKVQRVKLENGLSGMISKLQVDLNEWFSGAEIECRVSDKHNKQVKGSPQKIMIKKGGADPEVLIYTLPEARDPNHESVVCEVRGSSLGDVYIMWQVNGGPYQEGKTGVVKQQNGSKSHVSILTVNSSGSDLTKFTCAVRHSGMKNYTSPKMADYSKREPGVGDEDVLLCTKSEDEEEDEYSSMWSTTTSFIFLFLFSLVYSAILSLVKVKH
ncbi:sialoadhesin-like [Sardina pilchardus]|uniref:sialoadhesin-like n=1 Tax=Sardina pilchardus TaxID=27697 RepID=UPI002E0E1295